MYQFCYKLNEHDYFEFNRYHIFSSPAYKKTMLFNQFGAPTILFACGLFLRTIMKEKFLSYSFNIFVGIIAILWMIFFKWITTNELKRTIGKLKKSGKLPLRGDVAISFENDFFVETTEIGESKIKYSAIEHVVMTEKAIYLYTSVMEATLLPLTIFSDEQKRDDFIAFIEKKRVETK